MTKLHLGCGSQHKEGYINMDFHPTEATDVVCDVRKLDLPDESVKVIETYHAIEHFPRHSLLPALREWNRVLISGGMLIIECPDFDTAAKEYLEGSDFMLNVIFGRQRFPNDAHLFGYNFDRLKDLLEEAGFVDVCSKPPQDYHSQECKCLRIEAQKE